MYLASPQGTHNPFGSAMITRRRLKALFPVFIVLLLVPFFVPAFYGGDRHSDGLLARARHLYSKNVDDDTSAQASLQISPVEAGGEVSEGDSEPPALQPFENLTSDPDRPASQEDYSVDDSDDLSIDQEPLDHDIDSLDQDLPDYDEKALEYELLDYDQSNSNYDEGPPEGDYGHPSSKSKRPLLNPDDFLDDDDESVTTIPDRGDYRELFSLTTKDRRYISIFFEGARVSNPSVIPHPLKFDLWIVLAQQVPNSGQSTVSKQAVCEAGFLDGVLVCAEAFSNLTMSSFVQGACEGELAYLNDYTGAQDVHMFYGHEAPYILYGSQSEHTCRGIWLQDARALLEPFHLQKPLARFFSQATEMQRAPPYKSLEANFILFWDVEGKAYIQHEIWPKRSFAQIDIDGSVGGNLASATMTRDQVCMAQYMPRVNSGYELLQQASNSLAITLCKREDPTCKPVASNTFIMQLIHHTFSYDSHEVHEPYIVLFQHTAPFALHAISQRPFWIHGREALTNLTSSPQYESVPEEIPEGHMERFSILSISWKNHVQRYQGYIDDIVMLGVGIEDGKAGVMDVTASDLLQDLAIC